MSVVVTSMRGQSACSTMCAASGSNQKLNSWRGLVANSGSAGLRIEAAAHDDDAFGERGEFRIDGDGERDVGERAGGVDGDLVRMRAHLADEEVRGVFVERFDGRQAFRHGRNFVRAVRSSGICAGAGGVTPDSVVNAWSDLRPHAPSQVTLP